MDSQKRERILAAIGEEVNSTLFKLKLEYRHCLAQVKYSEGYEKDASKALADSTAALIIAFRALQHEKNTHVDRGDANALQPLRAYIAEQTLARISAEYNKAALKAQDALETLAKNREFLAVRADDIIAFINRHDGLDVDN
jgi:hypothetical protein